MCIRDRGRCLKEGLPKMISVNSDEVREAVTPVAKAVADAVCHVLERTPPELVGDVAANGIVMTGGGSLIYGMDRLIAVSYTHLDVYKRQTHSKAVKNTSYYFALGFRNVLTGLLAELSNAFRHVAGSLEYEVVGIYEACKRL